MNTTVSRIEFKFHLSQELFEKIEPVIASHLGVDQTAPRADYPIVSEYWDSPQRDIYWERVRGLSERRKFRIRIYGTCDGAIPPAAFLEIKHKSAGEGVKRRLAWDVGTLGDIQKNLLERLSEGVDDLPYEERFTRHEIIQLVKSRKLMPSCQIRYNRMAYEGGSDGEELRITFDSGIRCRTENRTLAPDCQDFPLAVAPDGLHIMEIKAHRTLPYWVREMIGDNHLLPRGFSKYGTAMALYDPFLQHLPQIQL